MPELGTPDQSWNRRILKQAGGGMLAVIGFLLSPISWWNDLLINIPLAYLLAGSITWMRPEWFNVAFVVGYLLTNLVGLVLLQYGMKHTIRPKKLNFKRELKSSLLWSGLYTLLIVVLLLIGWIRPPLEYLH